MRIEHVALWSPDIERMKHYYERYFGATASLRYENPAKRFQSYFLSFESGARLELMQHPDLAQGHSDPGTKTSGYAHLAVSVGSEARVSEVTERLRSAGYRVIDGPRRTGDGYFESVVLDPDGNRIELTV